MTDQANDREGTIAWLSELLQLVCWIDDCSQEKAAVEARCQPFKPFKQRWRKKQLIFCLIGAFVVIAALLVVAQLLYALVKVMAASDPNGVWHSFPVFPVWLIVTALLLVWAAVGFGAYLVHNRWYVVLRNRRIELQNARIEERNVPFFAQAQQIADQINEAGWIYREDFAHRFPVDYAYKDAVAFVLRMVQQHRADTVKEALNLYEQTLHQQRMEQSQAAILAEQERTRQQMAVGFLRVIDAVRKEGAATRRTIIWWSR